jgi:hypothetical protein
MPNPHNYREFFFLVKNPNNTTNAKAVCKYCSQNNGGVQIAASIPGCFTTNKANLCRTHLSNCIHFNNAHTNDEISEILSRPVDKRKINNPGNMQL